MKANVLVFLGLALGLGLGSAALAGPDLVADFNTSSGAVTVTNVGDGDAAASWATVECVAPAGGCPDPAPAQAAPYVNGLFPDTAAIAIPALAPGEAHVHVIAFFDSLVFAPGSYGFVVCADAGRDVREDFERNCFRFSKRVRGRPAAPGGLVSNIPRN